MSRAGKIARRSFLVGAVAAAGGVAFGVWRYRTPYANPLLAGLNDGEAALTPYVLIRPDGITLITPRADKGQGAYQVQAMLLAEELDVRPDQVSVDPGPPDVAYWNRALAEETAAFLVPGDGLAQDAAETVVSAASKFLGLQITGGSTTTPDGFDKLRAAGASARETLKAAAAGATGHAADTLSTRDGAVLLPDGSTLAYTDLAAQLAEIEPVTDVALRQPSEWRLIGHATPRLDMVAKSTGTQGYGIDVELPGMVHATVVLNPAQNGALGSYDTGEAFKIPGVQSVVEITGGLGVVADTTWTAFKGARALAVSWPDGPVPPNMDDHWQALSDSFDEDALDSRKRDDGDVDAAIAARAGNVIEAEYRAPYLAHAPLEPVNATVRVDEDSVEIWTGTQIPRFVLANVARITGVAEENITLNVQMIGGSFGHRLEDTVVRHATEIAMEMRGTPVKLTYSREEDMTHDFPRQIAMGRMRGTVRDGRVEAFELGIAMPSVILSQMARQGQSVPGPDSQIVAGAFEQPFALPHQRVTGYRAPLLAPISSWRSVGASTNGFFYNAGLDELIHAAGADPLEERLRLCNDPLARAVLEAVGEMSDWTGPNLGDGVGRGVAFTKSFGVPCAEVVEVETTQSGLRIRRAWVAAEVGTVVDPLNFENQVAGGVIFGLGHAMNCEITYADGRAEQQNFDSFQAMRLYQTPRIEVRGLENGDRVRGVGEPPVPPAAPALAAAIFAATGTRLREMPFSKFVDFA
ncbi:Isoquinoline 1-oxidoreductase subunit beta [Roseovarius sp. THAF8]|uniref:xanthine dehydrogenase family protein molybdopterin-binding subunit n=1 Tax=Roseovarius sp. THAF8 TaxID=2587846 RepID=UPI00126796C5|nr:molybdopterin cofactor-binding domain-containing protein [Roseovarius sp. THAF8]QFT96020.1 Isoquinoline 1-oxidoreductase subunit beta [Roseovarius sp. THAF8]